MASPYMNPFMTPPMSALGGVMGQPPAFPFSRPPYEEEKDDEEGDRHGPALVEERGVVRLKDVKDAPDVIVRSSGSAELDKVLSQKGGFVRPFSYIFAGEPGSGKSRTLRRALVAMIEEDPNFVAMYGATEESADEVFGTLVRAGLVNKKNRAAIQDRFLVFEGRNVEQLIAHAEAHDVQFLVGDSLNEYLSENEKGGRGDSRQYLAVAYLLRAWAHKNKATSAIVAQVNKDLDVAGAKALEHAVDAMIYHEIERRVVNGREIATSKRRVFTKGKHRKNKSGVESFFWMTDESIEEFDETVHGVAPTAKPHRVAHKKDAT
jgi:predicted ATP-dependent serine protease